MEVIRIFDLRQFDRTSRRFRDVVYRNSAKPPDPSSTPDGRGGFSVFEVACACPGQGVDSDCICCYIARFYPAIAPEPCVYWAFNISIFNPPNPNPNHLPSPVLVSAPSDTGDPCHRNMHNVSDNRFDKYRRTQTEQDLRICANGRSEPFTANRAIELYKQYYPDPA